MYMGLGALNPDGADGPADRWLERLRPLNMNIWVGSVGDERVWGGYANCSCCGIVCGNGWEGGYVCIRVGLMVCEPTSGISSLLSSNARTDSSSS